MKNKGHEGMYGSGTYRKGKALTGDAKSWNDAAPEMARQNAKRPMVIEQSPNGIIMGRTTSAKPTPSRGMGKAQGAFIDGKPASMHKGQGAYINDGTVPVVKGKKKLEMCPDCGKPMFGGKCSCGGDMGKSMRKGMTKGDMCKCGSGMTKAMCKCGGMSKAAKSSKSSKTSNMIESADTASRTKMSPADMAEQARWDGLTKKVSASMRKAMPVAQPNPTNSRPIQDPGMPPKSRPMPPPRNPGPMKPTGPIAKPMPKSPMPMPTPGKSGQYGGINPAGMYGKVSKRSK